MNNCDPSPECYPSKPSCQSCDQTQTHTTEQPESEDESDSIDSDVESMSSDSTGDDIESDPVHISRNYEFLDEEITIRCKQDGSVIPKTLAVEHYVRRTKDLHDLCVWDYFARVEKVCKNMITNHTRRWLILIIMSCKWRIPSMTIVEEDTADAEDDTSNETNCHESIPYQFRDILWNLHYHPNPLLTDNWRKRPRIEFAHDHSDHKTHHQKIRPHHSRLVPVPVGPSIPCRDR